LTRRKQEGKQKWNGGEKVELDEGDGGGEGTPELGIYQIKDDEIYRAYSMHGIDQK
jgi:hypothetical protein